MNARVVTAAVAAAAMSLALTACSPSKEDPSDLPPGSEPELQISAPSSAPPADEGGEECAIGDFTVKGTSGRQPTVELPEDCTTVPSALKRDLDKGEGPAVKDGDTVLVNYVIHGLSSHNVQKTWTSATATKPERLVVGDADLIPELDAALVGMKAGGRRLIVLPPPEPGAPGASEELGFEPTEALVAVVGVTQIG